MAYREKFSALRLQGNHYLSVELRSKCIPMSIILCTIILAAPITTVAQTSLPEYDAVTNDSRPDETETISVPVAMESQPDGSGDLESELPQDFWETPQLIESDEQPYVAPAAIAQPSAEPVTDGSITGETAAVAAPIAMDKQPDESADLESELPPDFWETPQLIESDEHPYVAPAAVAGSSAEPVTDESVASETAAVTAPLAMDKQLDESADLESELPPDFGESPVLIEPDEQPYVTAAEAESSAESESSRMGSGEAAAVAAPVAIGTQLDASADVESAIATDAQDLPQTIEGNEPNAVAVSQTAEPSAEPETDSPPAIGASAVAVPVVLGSELDEDAPATSELSTDAGDTPQPIEAAEPTEAAVAQTPDSAEELSPDSSASGEAAAVAVPVVLGSQLDRDAWTGNEPPTDTTALLQQIMTDDQTETGARVTPTSESSARPPPGSSRSIEAATITLPPVIDGYLDDFVWIENEPTTDFWVIQQQVWPEEQTEVTVLTDGQFIYFGLMMYDSQPGEIMALEAVRDRGLGFDDQVSVQINSTGDHTEVSRFSVNARGTQSDRLAGGSAANISWKGDWDAAVKRTPNGWSAELAIPFAMLKYPAGTNQFSINVARYQNRSRQWSYWADTTPQNRPEEMGLLTSIDPPVDSIERRTWTIMPFALAGINVVDREGELQEEMLTAGVDLRYTPSSNATGVVSINPDFTQVEAQVASANFSYNEQEVAEARVFFQEGETYFGEDLRFFYSPRVPDFVGGGKIFGQTNSLQYGSFISQSPDSRTDVLGRFSYAFTPTYSSSVIATGTDREEVQGATVGVSGSGRQEIGTFWDFDLGAVSNSEVKIYDDDTQFCGIGKTECDSFMLDGRVGWQGDYWSTGVSYDKYDKEFLPANGLIRTDRLGTSAWDVFINQYRDYGNQTISETTFDIVRTLRKTEDGRDQYDGWFYGGSLEWFSFARTGLSYNQGDYRAVAEVDDPLDPDRDGLPIVGEFGDTVTDDFFWTASLDLNTRGSRINLYSAYSSGELAGGDYDYGYVYLFARPTYNTSISINVERTELAYPDFISVTDQIITDAGWDITPTDSITFRHIYFDLSEDLPQFPEFSSSTKEQYWRLGYRRVVTSGLDVFLLYDDQPFEDATYSVKLLWTIQ